MPIQKLPDVELWYDEYGDEGSAEVVLSSAMGFSGDSYPERLSEPPTDYRVITIQARGFGRSTRVTEEPPAGWLAQWADDVVAFADAKGIDRFIYTGASHGAGIGWYIATRHPERLKAFISVVGTPHDRNGITNTSESRRRVIEARMANDTATIREQLEKLGGFLHEDEAERRRTRDILIDAALAKHLDRDDGESQINQGMPFPEARDNDALAEVLRTIDVPVLMLAGMRDGVVSPESALRGVRNVRNSKAVFFESEGHYLAGEVPERLIREVKVYIDELNGVAMPRARERGEREKVGTV
ncbi:alpha/beta fold hydrolase [Microbacterium sp. G2-8]|uniref:alpha/beta fold hydrolase n=1 Tax=Microbacterium sp. G2-8 TaxID=2842454 RepID=UPI001C8A4332|nr:alpha/beta hydrolase [Microbacterium sp. G2-8]